MIVKVHQSIYLLEVSKLNHSLIVTQNHFLEKILPLYRQCTEDELKLCPGDWKYGSFYTTLLTDSRLYQEWAKQW